MYPLTCSRQFKVTNLTKFVSPPLCIFWLYSSRTITGQVIEELSSVLEHVKNNENGNEQKFNIVLRKNENCKINVSNAKNEFETKLDKSERSLDIIRTGSKSALDKSQITSSGLDIICTSLNESLSDFKYDQRFALENVREFKSLTTSALENVESDLFSFGVCLRQFDALSESKDKLIKSRVVEEKDKFDNFRGTILPSIYLSLCMHSCSVVVNLWTGYYEGEINATKETVFSLHNTFASCSTKLDELETFTVQLKDHQIPEKLTNNVSSICMVQKQITLAEPRSQIFSEKLLDVEQMTAKVSCEVEQFPPLVQVQKAGWFVCLFLFFV